MSLETAPVLNSSGNVAFVHRLKCWWQNFDAIALGLKRAEVRVEEDRKFKAGDMLDLLRTDVDGNETSPRTRIVIEVLHVERFAGPLELCGATPDDGGGLKERRPIAVLSLRHSFEKHTHAAVTK